MTQPIPAEQQTPPATPAPRPPEPTSSPPNLPPSAAGPSASAPPTVVTPEPESRLDALLAEWAPIKARLAELTAREKELNTAIKAEAMRLAPATATEAVLRSPHLPTPYRIHPVTSWRLDSKTLKKELPETWVRYADQSTSWRLEAIKTS